MEKEVIREQKRILKYRNDTNNLLEKSGEDPSNISFHIVVVKTANAPDLVERFIKSFIENKKNSQTSLETKLIVLDDSRNTNRSSFDEVFSKLGLKEGEDITYVRNEENYKMIGDIRNRLLNKYSENEKKKESINALNLLLTEGFETKSADDDLNNSNPGYLSQKYSHLGQGHASTVNIAALLAAYEMGKRGKKLEECIWTHNDDDILYQGIEPDRSGNIKFSFRDYLALREVLFRDPQTLISAGKYVGVTGSPLSMLRSLCDIVAQGAIFNDQKIAKESRTPFAIFDSENNKFGKQLSVKEFQKQFPDIIKAYLERTPLTFFKQAESFSSWLTGSNIRYDEGNYTERPILTQKIPNPPGAIPEFIRTGLIRTLYRNENIERIFKLEDPIAHLRKRRKNGGDGFTADLLESVNNEYNKDQLLFYELLQDDEISYAFQEAFNDFGITSDLLRKHIPNFLFLKKNILCKIRSRVPSILYDYEQLKNEDNKKTPLIEAYRGVLKIVDKNVLNSVEKSWDDCIQDNILKNSAKNNFLNFIKSIQYWKEIYLSAYEEGRESNKKNSIN